MQIVRLVDFPDLPRGIFANMKVESSTVKIEFVVPEKEKSSLLFRPFQASRIMPRNCLELPEQDLVLSQGIFEAVDSPWITELKASLCDSGATFMNKAHHFIVNTQDKIIEIVAWNMELKGEGTSIYFKDPSSIKGNW